MKLHIVYAALLFSLAGFSAQEITCTAKRFKSYAYDSKSLLDEEGRCKSIPNYRVSKDLGERVCTWTWDNKDKSNLVGMPQDGNPKTIQCKFPKEYLIRVALYDKPECMRNFDKYVNKTFTNCTAKFPSLKGLTEKRFIKILKTPTAKHTYSYGYDDAYDYNVAGNMHAITGGHVLFERPDAPTDYVSGYPASKFVCEGDTKFVFDDKLTHGRETYTVDKAKNTITIRDAIYSFDKDKEHSVSAIVTCSLESNPKYELDCEESGRMPDLCLSRIDGKAWNLADEVDRKQYEETQGHKQKDVYDTNLDTAE